VTVKLVCIDCHRWDFSSTQGFINHCRIAHARDFKSHELAAVHCGHPIEVDENGGIIGDDSKPAVAAAAAAAAAAVTAAPSAAPTASGLVHPLVRDEAASETDAYKAVLSRIRASLDLYHSGKLPGVRAIPKAPTPPRSKLVESSETPFLSQLMRKKKLGGDLHSQVQDAKTQIDWGLAYQTDDDDRERLSSEELDSSLSAARTPAVMRMPARSAARQESSAAGAAPPSSTKKSRGPMSSASLDFSDLPGIFDDDMDVDLSPNTIASNNAPSLVSDDGEYDDSDDGSGSDDSDAMESESVSDVAEINIDSEDHEVAPPRAMHRSGSNGNGKKDEPKHVTFVPTPIPASGKAKGRRKQATTGKPRA